MTQPILTSGYSISLPVFAGVEVDGGAFRIEGEVQGTAFALGGNYMLTARHVASGIPRSGKNQMVVGLQEPDGHFKAARVSSVEELDADLALLEVEFLVPGSDAWFHRFGWREAPIEPFEAVRTVGYAYGMQTIGDRKSVVVRGFQGHIVSRLTEFKPVGWTGSSFAVYELSFVAPRGLSGAPLMNSQGTATVHGVVIGNSESKMMVFRSEERVNEPAGVTAVEQYEALTLGVAVVASEVLSQESRVLGSSIKQHLQAHGLLA